MKYFIEHQVIVVWKSKYILRIESPPGRQLCLSDLNTRSANFLCLNHLKIGSYHDVFLQYSKTLNYVCNITISLWCIN